MHAKEKEKIVQVSVSYIWFMQFWLLVKTFF